jgi:ribonuclease P protein component
MVTPGNGVGKIQIKKRRDIEAVFREGKREKIGDFSVYFRQNSLCEDRICILVSRKNGTAVQRNRIKRIFREAFRLIRSDCPPFLDILVMPHSRNNSDFREIREKLSLWRKAMRRTQKSR